VRGASIDSLELAPDFLPILLGYVSPELLRMVFENYTVTGPIIERVSGARLGLLLDPFIVLLREVLLCDLASYPNPVAAGC
jgi:hypothetical protein